MTYVFGSPTLASKLLQLIPKHPLWVDRLRMRSVYSREIVPILSGGYGGTYRPNTALENSIRRGFALPGVSVLCAPHGTGTTTASLHVLAALAKEGTIRGAIHITLGNIQCPQIGMRALLCKEMGIAISHQLSSVLDPGVFHSTCFGNDPRPVAIFIDNFDCAKSIPVLNASVEVWAQEISSYQKFHMVLGVKDMDFALNLASWNADKIHCYASKRWKRSREDLDFQLRELEDFFKVPLEWQDRQDFIDISFIDGTPGFLEQLFLHHGHKGTLSMQSRDKWKKRAGATWIQYK